MIMKDIERKGLGKTQSQLEETSKYRSKVDKYVEFYTAYIKSDDSKLTSLTTVYNNYYDFLVTKGIKAPAEAVFKEEFANSTGLSPN